MRVGNTLHIAGQEGADAQGRAPAAAAVRAKYFGANRPASTLVGVARLASPDYKVEIEATAVVPEAPDPKPYFVSSPANRQALL